MADMRDRIAEIIRNANMMANPLSQFGYAEADALLANGFILPPCKVGERIYKVYKDCHLPGDCYTTRMCSRCEYAEFGIEEAFFEFSMLNKNGELPYPYFVTREAAEKALREKENG